MSMKMKNMAMRTVIAVIGAAALTFTATGMAGAQQAGAFDALKAKVQGKSLSVVFGSPPNLAEVHSVMTVNILKDKFGINATYQAIPADVSAAAVVSGSADVGEVSLGRLAGLKQGGADIQIFGANDYVNDFVILGKAPAKTIADLKGQVYGDSGSAGIGLVLRNGCFSDSGIATSDVKLVELGSSGATAKALATPQLQAGLVHADAAASLQAKFPNTYNVLCYTYKKVSAANDVWYANRSWLEANPDLATAVNVASLMASRQLYADKQDWLTVAKSFVTDLIPSVAENTYDLYNQIGVWDVNGALSQKDCTSNIEILVKLKILSSSVDCSTLQTEKFQTEAQGIVGPATKPTNG
jgi:ABC-type nitrate/sulfonate/bicarbonate transport system substrate-binding protein